MSKLFYIINLGVILFIAEIIVRLYLNKSSLEMMEYVNKNNIDYCYFWGYFDILEKDGRYLLLIVVLNFTNTYAALSFIFLDASGVFINGILKLFYIDPRPFWIDTNLFPCICAVNYGTPSTTGLNHFLNLMGVYRTFRMVRPELNKTFLLIICWFLISLLYISRFFQNAHTFQQLFYGMGVGYIIYYIYFDIIGVDFNNKKQFVKINDNLWKIVIVIFISFILGAIIITIFNINEPINETWLASIVRYCDYIPYNYFGNESYQKAAKLFMLIGSLIAFWTELKLIFKNNSSDFIDYNFDPKFIFNNTNLIKGLLRVLTLYLIYYFIFKNVNIITDFNDGNYFYLTFFGYIIPYFVYGFLIFFVLKYLLVFVSLTNEDIHHQKAELYLDSKKDEFLINH